MITIENLPITYAILFAVIFILFYIKEIVNNHIDPFEPYLGLSILLFLYSISTLLYFAEYNSSIYGEHFSVSVLNEYVATCLIGQFGLSTGFLLSRKFRKNSIIINNISISKFNLTKISYLILIVFSPAIYESFNFLDVSSYADTALTSRLDRMLDDTAGIKDVLLRDIPIIIILGGMIMQIFDSKMNFFIRGSASLIFFSYVLTAFLSGWRGKMITPIILMIIYYHYHVRKIPLKYYIIIGLLIYFIINAMSIARLSSDFFEMISLVYNNFKENGASFLNLNRSGELLTSGNLVKLISEINNGNSDYKFGEITYNQIASFVPRYFWPERPLTASEMFVHKFYSGVLESGGGYGSFFLLESYWDFGIIGAFFYSLAFAILVRFIYYKLICCKKDALYLYFYAVLYSSLILTSVRSGMLGVLKSTCIAIIPIIIMFLLRKLSIRKKL